MGNEHKHLYLLPPEIPEMLRKGITKGSLPKDRERRGSHSVNTILEVRGWGEGGPLAHGADEGPSVPGWKRCVLEKIGKGRG